MMKNYVKSFAVLAIALLCSTVVLAQNDELYGWEKAPRYRGFFGEGYLLSISDINDYSSFIYTSHGFQINSVFFVGAGVAANYWWNGKDVSVPLFVDARAEFHHLLCKNFSPYVANKVGYSFGYAQGPYVTPQVGCHFYFGHSKVGVSAAVGYTYQANIPIEGLGNLTTEFNGLEISVAVDI